LASEDHTHAALLELASPPAVDPNWDDVVRRAGRERRRRRQTIAAALVAAAVLPALAFGGLRLIASPAPDLHGSGSSESLGLSADFAAHRVRAFRPVGRTGPLFGGLRWTLQIRQAATEPTSAYLDVFAQRSTLRLRLCGPCGAKNGGVLLRPGLWLTIAAQQERHPARVEVRSAGGTLRFEVRR
jgi:hypothetical protein